MIERRTITTKRYNRVYKRWNNPSIALDIQTQWDKNNPYHTNLNSLLKNAIEFPDYQWDNGAKARCLKDDKITIGKVINLLENAYKHKEYYELGITQPYLCESLHFLLDDAPDGVEKIVVPLGVRMVKDAIHMRMNKDNVARSIVSGMSGRRWKAESSEWSVPLSSCMELLSLLDEQDGCADMASSIRELPEVATYLEGKVERIAISDAISLEDEETLEDMKSRLAVKFNPDLELFGFQYVGVRYAELSGGRCLIADDMGVGKTIQAIAYAALHPECWPVLIVTPLIVEQNWKKEILRWVKDVTVQVVEKGNDELEDVDFTVITYAKMSKQESNLLKRNFNLVVFDECDNMKNAKAKRTMSCVKVGGNAKSILCMSGTPISNRPIDFFTILQMLRPADWKGRWQDYVLRYCDGRRPEDNHGYWYTKGASNTQELNAMCRDFMIRRLKTEVLPQLPKKVRQSFIVQPSEDELDDYMETQASWVSQYDMYKAHKGMPRGFVLNMMTDLRKLCGHLKVNSAVKYIEDYRGNNNNKPIIVYTHHKDVLEDCMSECMASGIKRVAKITGDTLSKKRQEIVDSFQDGYIDIVFCSITAANAGITLTAADTVVFLEREWVSGWEEQAEDRVLRIGATGDTCWAIYLTVDGTIDQHFDRVVEEKRRVISSILNGTEEAANRGEIVEQILQGMVESGQVPASMLDDYRQGKGNNKGAKKYE